MTGIDYGMIGQVNRNIDTGIHYGVVPVNSLDDALWAYDFESDYGSPSCPKCGSDVEEFDPDVHGDFEQEGDRGCADYACTRCEITLDSQYAYSETPLGFKYDKDGIVAVTDSDAIDVFVTESPFFALCEFCSPCAPGAGYCLNEGNVKAYCLGHDFFPDGKAPYRVFSVETGLEVLP